MATAGAVAAIIGAAAAVYGGVQQRKARKEQERQNRVANRIAATRRRRSIRAAIARGRVQRAQQESAGFALGVSGGTAVQGAVQGTASSVNEAITASNQQFTGQQVIAESQNRISQFLSNAETAGTIGQVAGAVTPQSASSVSNLFSFGG